MLESLEGKRGIVRAKPPLPAITGLLGKPTVINNVISFASVPLILARGAAWYKTVGTENSLRLAVAMPPATHYFSPCEQCGYDDDGPRQWDA